MRTIKNLVAGLAMTVLLTTGAFAGSDINEVGAVLVFPAIVALDNDVIEYESYATITNASPNPVTVHVSYINGERDANYCHECDFSFPMSGNDTETLIIRWDPVGGIVIETEPDGFGGNFLQHSCEFNYGMLVASLEDGAGNTITDNVLLGEQVVVNYDDGYAFSIPAIPFQGANGGNGDRKLGFDDVEYGKMPRIVATDFNAPFAGAAGEGQVITELVLFTLNFRRQFAPSVDCSVTGFDADENPFSRSIFVGCWDYFELEDISPEFAYPNLGLFGQADTHGWLQLNCQAQARTGSVAGARGGVHGALVTRMESLATLRPNDNNPPRLPAVNGQAAFGRLLYQSVTTGDAVTLTLEEDAGSVGGMF